MRDPFFNDSYWKHSVLVHVWGVEGEVGGALIPPQSFTTQPGDKLHTCLETHEYTDTHAGIRLSDQST